MGACMPLQGKPRLGFSPRWHSWLHAFYPNAHPWQTGPASPGVSGHLSARAQVYFAASVFRSVYWRKRSTAPNRERDGRRFRGFAAKMGRLDEICQLKRLPAACCRARRLRLTVDALPRARSVLGKRAWDSRGRPPAESMSPCFSPIGAGQRGGNWSGRMD